MLHYFESKILDTLLRVYSLFLSSAQLIALLLFCVLCLIHFGAASMERAQLWIILDVLHFIYFAQSTLIISMSIYRQRAREKYTEIGRCLI